MLKKTANQEIEIKLRVADSRALALRLKQLRAQKIIPRTYESNTLYDTRSRDVTRKGQLIRIRIEQPCSRGSKNNPGHVRRAILTYKGPFRSFRGSASSRSKRSDSRRFKVREEVEVVIGDGEEMSRILWALGFDAIFLYEKFRTTYTLPGIRDLKVEFDETPVGLFLELEGNATSIDRGASLLGYSRSDFMTATYGDLYIADCARRGRKPSNMVFRRSVGGKR